MIWAHRALAWGLYPAVMVGAGALGWACLEAWPGAPELALAAPAVLAAGLVLLAERFIPYRGAWGEVEEDVPVDAALALAALVVTQALIWGTTLAAARWVEAGAALESAWPGGWPLAAQVALYLGLVEFLGYWAHRALHRVEPLWRVHATHHQARRLYWLNGFRLHPLDAAFMTAASLCWAVVCGVPAAVVALGGALTTAHLLVQHSNAAIQTGWLAPWLATAEFHRWHHDIEDDARNYGHVSGIWDVVFGSWQPGRPGPELTVGLPDPVEGAPPPSRSSPRP